MKGHDETCGNELSEGSSNTFDYNERLHEIQLINDILIDIYQAEDTDRIYS